jgi:hypothetical protein
MSEQIDKVTKTDDVVPSIMSAGQTKPGKPFYLGEEESGPESDAHTDTEASTTMARLPLQLWGATRRATSR